MRNPLRDEAAAFRLVLLTLGAATLIVVGSWINAWLGLAVFLVLLALGLRALRGELKELRAPAHVEHAGATRRILVIANETVAGRELVGRVRDRTTGLAEVLVVCPALNSRIRTWMSDEDGARAAAQARLDESLAALAAVGVRASGQIGDGDPLQALEDALRTFPADEIVISTHPPGRSNWLERGVVQEAGERYDVPVRHVVVDLTAQQ
jgi:hypothetical protein